MANCDNESHPDGIQNETPDHLSLQVPSTSGRIKHTDEAVCIIHV